MSAESKNVFQRLVGHLTDATKWITEQLAEETTRTAVFADLGLTPTTSEFPDLTEHFDSIDAYRKKQDPDAEALKAAVEDLQAIKQAIRNFVRLSQGAEPTDAVFESLILLMSSNYLRLKLPIVYWLGQPLGLLGDAFATGALPRDGTKATAQGFADFFRDPITYLDQHLGELRTEEQARRTSHAIFAPLSLAFVALQKKLVGHRDVQLLYGWEPDPASTTPLADRLSQRTLSFAFATPDVAGVQTTVMASFALVPREHGGPGLFLSLGGAAEKVVAISEGWTLKTKLGSASGASLLVNSWSSLSGPADASAEFTLAQVPNPTGQPFTLSLGKRARLDLGEVSVSAGLSTNGPALRLSTGKSAFVLESSSNAVLERGMPKNGDAFRLDFQLALGLANGKFFLEGGTGLQVTLPVTRRVGPVEAKGLTLSLIPSSQPDHSALAFAATVSLTVTLGPVAFALEQIGIEAALSPEGMPSAGLRSPNGLAVRVTSQSVSGGGSISFDPVLHQYAGILQLSIQDRFTVSAIGLLNTRVNNQPAFSFLLLVNVTGLKWTMPFGFVITGLGLLGGLDREMNFDALEKSIENKSLDRLLFPKDPLANAAAIVADAGAVFPPKLGEYLFGFMLQITWGTSSLVRLELAVIVQGPTLRIALLGKLRAFFPTEAKAVLKIQIDLIGTLDFDRRRAFAHATLTASKLAGFTLSGGAALLLYWGDNSTFLISLGGFNPHYAPQVPAEFPKLPRLSLGLAQRQDVTLKFEFYCAITSNSFQIGGSFSLLYKKGKFSVEGLIAVDALFQSGEPSYVFDLVAKLQIKAFGQNLFLTKFEGTLSGSTPWHIVGKVTFEIWIFDYTLPIDHTWGEVQTPAALPPVNVGALLRAELADARNWTADLPAAAHAMVTLRPAPGGEVRLHPLGTLSVVQRVAPLGISLSRFGESRPEGQIQFVIDRVTVGSAKADTAPVREPFARAQFVEMADHEKLSAPAFERLDAGIRLNTGALRQGPVATATMDYDTLVYDAATGQAVPDAAPHSVKADRLLEFAAFSPAGRASGRKYAGPAKPLVVRQVQYVVTLTDDTTPLDNTSRGSFAATQAALDGLLRQQPRRRGQIQLLPVVR